MPALYSHVQRCHLPLSTPPASLGCSLDYPGKTAVIPTASGCKEEALLCLTGSSGPGKDGSWGETCGAWRAGRGVGLQPDCRKTSLEVFWCPPERLHSPALGKGHFSFPFSMGVRQVGYCPLVYCFPFCSTAKRRETAIEIAKSTNQLFRNFRAALIRGTTIHPHSPSALSPLHKQVPQVTGNLTFLHHECAFHH